MWDERFSTQDYVYGTKPNDFLKDQITSIPKGKVLSLAEGEGRNAVFLAKQGYSVTAVDASLAAIDKGHLLAKNNGVEIDFVHADLTEFELGEHHWDGIISIFFPLPPLQRKALYKKVARGLKKSGIFLLEAYTPKQLMFDTGGGKVIDFMQSKKSLAKELKGLDFVHLEELERNIIEGIYHTGIGSVVQAIAKKSI
jgi:SAM-dependent methyltransferase